MNQANIPIIVSSPRPSYTSKREEETDVLMAIYSQFLAAE